MVQIFDVLPGCHVKYTKTIPNKTHNSNKTPESVQRVGKVLLVDETQPDRKMAVVCDLVSKFVDLVEVSSCRLLYAYATGSYYDVHGEKVVV